MESHILNNYHCARYRSLGHNLLRTSECSEESCKTSPEYRQPAPYHWTTNQTINMTRSQETSSDEEENIEVQELIYEDQPETGIIEEQVLVEGYDYDVIQVYEVDPDLDLEVSSDDEEHEDFAINENIPDSKNEISQDEYFTVEENPHRKAIHESQGIDGLNFNLDTPVVSNVDEYFIKEDRDKDILAVKDEPIVTDVDEYFIKEEKPKAPNIDDFFIKHKLPEEEEVSRPVNVDEFFVSNIKPPENIEQNAEQNVIDQNNIDKTEDPITESDLEVLPKIEAIKRYLLEDISHSNFKNLQRSCSLPQSPMHSICLDIDDAKTCLSFEDLNLSDLTFENEKEKSFCNKSEDIPRTLTDDDVNSFLITGSSKYDKNNEYTAKPPEPIIEDDLSHQDMEIEHTVESCIEPVIIPQLETPKKVSELKTSTPIKSTVLNFCIEKTSVKKESSDTKIEVDDFVDVESCNDSVIPVLAANNLNSLLEQFEASEKLNTKPKKVIQPGEQKVKSSSLTNGMRLQDAGVQLNKTKMRQILMPSTVNTTVRRSPSPVHSDHDYCSSTKKRYSLPNIKGGQSLLKPEVLSSNNRILSSRHRSCRNKKVDYALSSDDESDKNNKSNKNSVSDIKGKKPIVKQTVKEVAQSTRKKLSPVHSVPNDFKSKVNNSVIVKDACKASDTPCSQNSSGSIKLTIKNKSEVILNCDVQDSQKDKHIEKCKSSVSEKNEPKKVETQENIKKEKSIKNIKEVVRNKKSPSRVENCTNIVKEESRPKEHFYTGLFSNKQDVKVPQAMVQIKPEKRSFEEEISIATKANKEADQPLKKKKLNLQEYKMRRCASSNNSSAAVSPEAIFPDMPITLNADKTLKSAPTPPNEITNIAEQTNKEVPKKFFDPIREASRKILMNTKKHKAEATRKRDEDIVMSKIPKVENLELQPLISDAEMMKIVGMTQPEPMPIPAAEKPQVPADIEEIVLVSMGVNTDEAVFKDLEKSERVKKSQSPADSKSLINFRIKKSDHVLKQNVFDSVKRERKSPVDERKPELKIDKERFKGITATLKSVKKQVDTKIYSNSLCASIQDVVKKKAPEKEKVTENKGNEKRSKSNSPKRKTPLVKPRIVRDYDDKADHGEDKIILHLGRDRIKPEFTTIKIQTDPNPEYANLPVTPEIKEDRKEKTQTPSRKRNDSDMSMSSDESPVRKQSKELEKSKERRSKEIRSQSKEKRSRSKERYDKYRTRSRSRSRSRRRRRSHSRSRSKSRGRFRRYRRSDSPYRRKRRSRSPYRRRSPSCRREYRSNRSKSRNGDARSKSPKKRSPQRNNERKQVKSLTPPPPRKPTISESSDSSTSSSSSSSSSDESRKSRSTCSPYRREGFRKGYRSSYSSEDRESNTPVEERRIVFVGKLEKDITKSSLRSQFTKFGPVLEVRLHSKEDGSRYGFVTFKHARDAWSAVEAAATFPQYDVGFGGRRAFCRQSYADLDGLEAKFTESAFHGSAVLPARRDQHMSFEQMLLDMKNKLSQRKGDKKDDKP